MRLDALSRQLARRRSPSFQFHPIQSLSQDDYSVLCLAANQTHLFCGTQGTDIFVWSLDTFLHVHRLQGHLRSVTCLVCSSDGTLLLSAGGDGTVRIWDAVKMTCLVVVSTRDTIGDVLALVLDESGMVYFGSQNTSIWWFKLEHVLQHAKQEMSHTVQHRFFQQLQSVNGNCLWYELDDEQHVPNSHYGYVYDMLIGQCHGEMYVFTSSGDGTIKLWKPPVGNSMEHYQTLDANVEGNIYSMLMVNELLFGACQDGSIKIWDVDTFQLVRSLVAHPSDVLCLAAACTGDDLLFYSGAADGCIKLWNHNFDCVHSWRAHPEQRVLALIPISDHWMASGGSDCLVHVWPETHYAETTLVRPTVKQHTRDLMLYALEKWIALATVSGMTDTLPKYREVCRRGADYLKSVFRQLGAESYLVYGKTNTAYNPLVIAKYQATTKATKPLNVLIYGHYDVVPVDEDDWTCPPYEMTGKDGYLYGRGVTDNKGPVMAMIFAVNELVTQQNLNVNVSFIIEGEEENGSQGFQEMVLENANFFDKPDVILLSNSYWLGENTPCLTYGLRGFIKFSIQVTNPHASNLHSGVDGGPSEEPLLLLTKLVSKLTDDDGQLVVEGFSDSVQPITQAEDDLYTQLVEHIYPNDTQKRQELKETLQKKWRYPCFSLHNIQASGPTNSAIIPKTATANASVRIVPNQDLDKIAHDMETHLVTVFDSFQSKCTLNVTASKRADWWLGDPNGTYFKCLQDCIQNEWKMSPFLIREGGSIPAVRWLERTFDAIALNLPMGQSSDAAHLSNERIRLQNLYAGKRIVQTFLSTI